MADSIVIKGAREHNLKNIDVELPRGKFVVITGLAARANPRWRSIRFMPKASAATWKVLSSYARQFLSGSWEKPDVDQIDGLSPAISIDQKSTSRNPRSTVATVTEIYRLPAATVRPHWRAALPGVRQAGHPPDDGEHCRSNCRPAEGREADDLGARHHG